MAQIWRRSGRGGASWPLGQGAGRIAYVDVDVHHGDGVQAAFYGDPRVLTISLDEHPAALRPGNGLPSETGGPAGGRRDPLPGPPGSGRPLAPERGRRLRPAPGRALNLAHLPAEAAGHTIDPGARIPAAWRELASRRTGRRAPEFMTEGNEARLRALWVRIRPGRAPRPGHHGHPGGRLPRARNDAAALARRRGNRILP